MLATMPAPPLTISLAGLPERFTRGEMIARARAAIAARQAATTPAAAPPRSEPVAAAALPTCPRLARITRAFPLTELRLDALRVAAEAKDMRDHIEGLAAGRSYGDPDLYGLTPADFAARFLPEARARAEKAGALADLLLALIGREAELETVLTEGACV